jgi:hypothetical protein
MRMSIKSLKTGPPSQDGHCQSF